MLRVEQQPLSCCNIATRPRGAPRNQRYHTAQQHIVIGNHRLRLRCQRFRLGDLPSQQGHNGV
jgi:hypothetical protein